MATRELRAQRREILGKKVAALRRAGLTPANLYGPGVAPTPLQLPTRELDIVLRRVSPSTFVHLTVDGEPPRRVLVREVQRHPVTDQTLHVDFFAASLSEPMRATVPLHFVGEAPAVTTLEGTLVHSLDAIEVECLPDRLPPRLDVDLSNLTELHAVIHVRDLPVPPDVTVLSPPEAVVVTVVPPKVEAEEVAAAEEPGAPAAPQPAAEE
ncbi:MAG: 50S ribosomal protein L25 [Chloroflexi bacterium]|nr:50S ribosomal protein L25 [Chloroflexota bacterium]